MNDFNIVRELRVIGERWNIPLLYRAADMLERIISQYTWLSNDHSRLSEMYVSQERLLLNLERENIALKVKLDQLYRENQDLKRIPRFMIGGKTK